MYVWSFSENSEKSRKLILWWGDCILVVDMSTENEKIYIISCPGGLLKLELTVHKAQCIDVYLEFSENLEISENWFYDEKIAFW